MDTPTIAVAYGDGHAPEVMEAVLAILREAGANLRVETIEIGSRIYAMDSKTGILPSAWAVLERAGVLLMAPIEVPEGSQHTACAIKERMGLDNVQPEYFYPLTLTLSPSGGEGIRLRQGYAGQGGGNVSAEASAKAEAAAGDVDATARAYKNEQFALFEPIYNEPLARGKSDPSPMLHAAIMLLVHLGQHETAAKIHNAWLVAMEEGFGNKKGGRLKKLVAAIEARLGKQPATIKPVEYKAKSTQEEVTGNLMRTGV